MIALESAGQQAAEQIGIAWRPVPHDGRWHETPAEGKGSRNGAGRIKLFDDGEGGIVFNHITGESLPFFSGRETDLDPAALETRRKRAEELRRQAEAERQQAEAECRKRAAEIWAQAAEAPADHPYLRKKTIKPHGAKVTDDGRLILPVWDVNGHLHGLQFIDADGRKKFLPGTAKTGHFFVIGDQLAGNVCLAEGFATAATIYEATGKTVVVAFDAGNLLAVAEAIHLQFPGVRLIVCADDDHGTKGNPGATKATEAAQVVDGMLAIPDFAGIERGPKDSDFNDLARLAGMDTVRRCIEGAARQVAELRDLLALDEKSGDEWPEPHPLPDGLHPVEVFDFDLLPGTLRPWAQDICERVQCPPDFVAVAIMTAMGSLVGRRLGIRPQARTDWTVTPNQWGLIVGRPGVLKSPSIEQALAPIKRLVAEAARQHAQAVEEYGFWEQAAEQRTSAAKRRAADLLKKDKTADIETVFRDLHSEILSPPVTRRYITNEPTPAALGQILIENQNGVLVHRDEMVSLLKSLDKEENADGRGFYLTGWNGDSGYTLDRIVRGMNLHIPAVCLSLLGGTQPGRLAEYVRHAVKGGAGDDGLIQRFGLVVWPDIGGEWRDVDRWPDNDAKRDAFRVFDCLDNLEPAVIGAQQDADYNGEPDGIPYLRFDGAARELFLDWRTDLETLLRSGDLHPALESHLAKYRKLVPGLALINHLADGGTGPVTEQATLQAVAWSEYLESHARRVYGSVSQPETAAAKAILSRIRKGDLKDGFSSRDVWRPCWSNLSDREQVADALRLLVDYGWLRESRDTGTGGRPSTAHQVNPTVLS